MKIACGDSGDWSQRISEGHESACGCYPSRAERFRGPGRNFVFTLGDRLSERGTVDSAGDSAREIVQLFFQLRLPPPHGFKIAIHAVDVFRELDFEPLKHVVDCFGRQDVPLQLSERLCLQRVGRNPPIIRACAPILPRRASVGCRTMGTVFPRRDRDRSATDPHFRSPETINCCSQHDCAEVRLYCRGPYIRGSRMRAVMYVPSVIPRTAIRISLGSESESNPCNANTRHTRKLDSI
jgi:hypothetical protein